MTLDNLRRYPLVIFGWQGLFDSGDQLILTESLWYQYCGISIVVSV